MSQSKLAEHAGLSTRGIADLERGARNFPYRDTVIRLAEALELSAVDRGTLLDASQRPSRPRGHTPRLDCPGSSDDARERDTPDPRPFVGRCAELRQLQAMLESARRGRGQLLLISGEPGIGKTRLCEELVARAADCGVQTHIGACVDGNLTPPFWPWVQLIRQRGEHNLLQLLGPGDHHAKAAEFDRFWLLDSVVQFWLRAAAQQPTLLVLEDLHWADPASLRLLRLAATQLSHAPLLIVGTYRDLEVRPDHPIRQLMAELTSDNQHISLGGLDLREVGELFSSLTGKPSQPELAADLHKRSGGNPLFLRELVQLLSSNAYDAAGPPQPVPGSGICSLIRKRLASVSRTCVELLRVAAVIGAETSAWLLEAADGRANAEMQPALQEAVRCGLLVQSRGAETGYQFAHTLVRDVLYAELDPPLRAALHQRVALAIMQHQPDVAAQPVEDLALHLARANIQDPRHALLATDYAERAGLRAITTCAYESAADYFHQALRTVDQSDQRRRGELLLALGRAQMRAGQTTEARSAYQAAAALARSAESPQLLIQAALEVGQQFSTALVDELEVQLLEAALAVLPIVDSTDRARVLARLGAALRFSPDGDRRTAFTQEAVSMARRLGDTATLAHVLLDVHYSDSNVMTPDARLAAATEAIHLAHADGNTLLALRGRSLRLGDFLELGEIPKFRIETEAYARQVDHLRQARFRWHVPLLKATLATLEGQFDEAERLVERGIALGRQGEQEAALEMAPAVLCALRFAQGRAAELESFVREHVRHSTPLPAWRAVLAYVLFESGRDGEAAIEFELLATDGFGRIASDNLQLCSLALLSLTCAGLRDGRRAQLLYELVLPFADYVAHATPFGAGCLGSMAHYAGLLAATGGHWDAAVEHFERAIEVHAKLRAKAFLANSRFHLARALRARGNIAAAEDQLAKAESIARVLGIRLHLAGID